MRLSCKCLFSALLILISLAYTQAPDTLWTKTYGGEEGDEGYSVQQTIDGGYIIAGETWSFGAGLADVWLLKTNADGDTLWTKTYGGEYFDGGHSVQQTTDGGYIIAGYTERYETLHDVYLIKTDSSGDTLWTKKYGGGGIEIGRSVQQTSEGGYIIAADTPDYDRGSQGIYLIKTDSSGDTLWTRRYGGTPGTAGGSSVQQTDDGGYIVVGYTSVSAHHLDVWLLKTDTNGDTLWTKTYGGANYDVGYSVDIATDGGYIVAGRANSLHGVSSADVWLLRTDANGDTLWTKIYGDTLWDVGYSVQQTSDGGYIVAGYTESFSAGWADVWLLKTDTNGDTLWTKICGDLGNDIGYSVQQTADGGYIIAGYTTAWFGADSDVWLIKTEPDIGIEEKEVTYFKNHYFSTTIFSGPLILPEGRNCMVYDITGRVVTPDKMRPGVYFLEIDSKIVQKVVKVR